MHTKTCVEVLTKYPSQQLITDHRKSSTMAARHQMSYATRQSNQPTPMQPRTRQHRCNRHCATNHYLLQPTNKVATSQPMQPTNQCNQPTNATNATNATNNVATNQHQCNQPTNATNQPMQPTNQQRRKSQVASNQHPTSFFFSIDPIQPSPAHPSSLSLTHCQSVSQSLTASIHS
mgnify:CR=1 FL=1